MPADEPVVSKPDEVFSGSEDGLGLVAGDDNGVYACQPTHMCMAVFCELVTTVSFGPYRFVATFACRS